MHRFPKTGNGTSIPGQIGIPAVYSPMTRTLADLEFMWRAIMSMKPWTYDHSVCPHLKIAGKCSDIEFLVRSDPVAGNRVVLTREEETAMGRDVDRR